MEPAEASLEPFGTAFRLIYFESVNFETNTPMRMRSFHDNTKLVIENFNNCFTLLFSLTVALIETLHNILYSAFNSCRLIFLR